MGDRVMGGFGRHRRAVCVCSVRAGRARSGVSVATSCSHCAPSKSSTGLVSVAEPPPTEEANSEVGRSCE